MKWSVANIEIDLTPPTLSGWYGFNGSPADVNAAANGANGGPFDLDPDPFYDPYPSVEHFYNPNTAFYNSTGGGLAYPQSQIMRLPDLDGDLAIIRAWLETELADYHGGNLGYTSHIDYQFQGTIAIGNIILWFVIGASITGEGGFSEPEHYLSYYQSMQWQLTFYDPAFAYTGAMLDHGTQVTSYGVEGWGASVTGDYPGGLLVTTTVTEDGAATHSPTGDFVPSSAFQLNARNQVFTQYIAHVDAPDVAVMPELFTAYGVGYTPSELEGFMA